MGRQRPGMGAAAIAVIAVVGAAGMLAIGGCSGGSGGSDDDGVSADTGANDPDAADPGQVTAPSPTEGGDGIATMLRTVAVPCPAELGYLTSRSCESCYQLGQSGGLGTDIIESASVELDGGYWSVQLMMTESGLARFNGLAAQCLDRTPTCPTGRIAIVADRAVVSTATITKSDYERDEFMVTGRFDADEAHIVANALDP